MAVIFWVQSDLVDEAPKDLSRLHPYALGIQRGGQVRHLAAVDLGEARMEPHQVLLWLQILDAALETCFSIFEVGHAILHRRMEHAILDGVDNSVDLTLHVREFTLDRDALCNLILLQPVPLSLILCDELRDQIGVQQALAQSVQDPLLDLFPRDQGAIGTGAAVPGGRAPVLGRVHQRVRAHGFLRSPAIGRSP
ncbi:hypothetical protein ACRDNQ_09870 [Palleronia sp. KMU-117]|uniref:hypothetical protein n=1 Tax=Palleronia sp. KMU-117 TaxID=3434108 RepID=UPI003D7367F2